MTALFTGTLRPKLHTLAIAFVPELARATSAEWSALEDAVEQAVVRRPAALRRQLTSLIQLIDWLARLRYGRGLVRLEPATRDRLLERLAVSRFTLLRRGIWGLRTLIMLGWYTQAGVAERLGYRASALGWAAR